MAKKAVEQTGLIPRSIIRTFDRFRKQLFLETENLIIQEFRISRYQFLVSIKCLASLIFIPLGVNYLLKNFLLIPLTETFWNNKQSEIFLNSHQQQQAFNELKKFQEKLYFEYLLTNQVNFPFNISKEFKNFQLSSENFQSQKKTFNKGFFLAENFLVCNHSLRLDNLFKSNKYFTNSKKINFNDFTIKCFKQPSKNFKRSPNFIGKSNFQIQKKNIYAVTYEKNFFQTAKFKSNKLHTKNLQLFCTKNLTRNKLNNIVIIFTELKTKLFFNNSIKNQSIWFFTNKTIKISNLNFINNNINHIALNFDQHISEDTMKNLIKNKIVELAIYYNHQSILALTNLVGDFITFLIFGLVIMYMKPQISILKSFLTESIYSLNDTKKSFLLILGTDLLVGFHSPHGWEICLELLLRHFGFPENKDFVFLFVASFPVLLDTVFKYWIFRYLNKISPSTVATYHNMIE